MVLLVSVRVSSQLQRMKQRTKIRLLRKGIHDGDGSSSPVKLFINLSRTLVGSLKQWFKSQEGRGLLKSLILTILCCSPQLPHLLSHRGLRPISVIFSSATNLLQYVFCVPPYHNDYVYL